MSEIDGVEQRETNINGLLSLIRMALEDHYQIVNDAIVGQKTDQAQINLIVKFKVEDESGAVAIHVDSGVKLRGIGVPSTGWSREGQLVLFEQSQKEEA